MLYVYTMREMKRLCYIGPHTKQKRREAGPLSCTHIPLSVYDQKWRHSYPGLSLTLMTPKPLLNSFTHPPPPLPSHPDPTPSFPFASSLFHFPFCLGTPYDEKKSPPAPSGWSLDPRPGENWSLQLVDLQAADPWARRAASAISRHEPQIAEGGKGGWEVWSFFRCCCCCCCFCCCCCCCMAACTHCKLFQFRGTVQGFFR